MDDPTQITLGLIAVALGYVIGEHIFWRRVAREDAAEAKRLRIANGFTD